jgi:hypothetical protein
MYVAGEIGCLLLCLFILSYPIASACVQINVCVCVAAGKIDQPHSKPQIFARLEPHWWILGTCNAVLRTT